MTKEQPTPEDANNPTLADRLGMIERLEEELMRKGTALMKKNTALSHADMFILGATRRVLAQAKGFRMLIIERNFPCAAAILRMQLDTAMRMNGLLLVEDLDVFCDELLQGKRFN